MKPIFSALAAASLALFLTAPASAQVAQERVIRFGHLNNADHPVSFGVKRFSELLAAKSGGKMKVQEFPASQLGNELQQQSALQGGVQQMSAPATTSLAGIVKEFGLVDFPFSVSTFEQADALLDGPLGQALIAKLPEKGLVALGYWDLGFRNVTNSKHPITKAEDLDGLKIRVIPNPVFLETFRAFKANPVPMAFAELYGALEARAVDGQENPYAVTRRERHDSRPGPTVVSGRPAGFDRNIARREVNSDAQQKGGVHLDAPRLFYLRRGRCRWKTVF